MNIIEHFQNLEDSIVELPELPDGSVKARLLNELNSMREQLEAFQAGSDGQDDTLRKQIERITELETTVQNQRQTIATLERENQELQKVNREQADTIATVQKNNQELVEEKQRAKTQAWDKLRQQEHKLHHSKD